MPSDDQVIKVESCLLLNKNECTPNEDYIEEQI